MKLWFPTPFSPCWGPPAGSERGRQPLPTDSGTGRLNTHTGETSGVACSPVPEKLQGHEGENHHTEEEQEEHVEDVGQRVPDASESPSDL